MVNLKSKLKQAQKQRGALLVMNLVIIALCLILFWGTIHMFRQLNDAFSRPAKTNWMENNVQSENYAYLLVNYHEDMAYGGLLSEQKRNAMVWRDILRRRPCIRHFFRPEIRSELPEKRRRWMPHMKKWVTGILQRTASGRDLDWTDRFAVGIPAILLAACQTVGCRISIEYHTSVHRTMQSWLEQVPMAGWILWWIAETLLLDRCCDGCLCMQGETRQFRRTVSGKVSEREYF